MKRSLSNLMPRKIVSKPAKLLGASLLVSILCAGSLPGQMVTTSGKESPALGRPDTALTGKVMTDLPHYGDSPAPAPVIVSESKPLAGETAETVHLVPFHVVGEKGLKLSQAELLTKKAYAAAIFKEYDNSVFSLFQHREAKRLENASSLRSFADSLKLVGDREGSSVIREESDRLFLRPHDAETKAIDQLFNPRFR